jgi:hypothetical protein
MKLCVTVEGSPRVNALPSFVIDVAGNES